MTIDEFLTNLGISDHPGFRIQRRLEGYRQYTFGCRAGPGKANIKDLAHELAHAAQFGPQLFRYRATESGFVFKTRRIWVYDRFCAEPRTANSTLRELDTFAHQAHLMELAGIAVDKAEMFDYAGMLMTKWMPDWYHHSGKGEEERKSWCSSQAHVFYEQLDPLTVLDRLVGWLDATARRLARCPVDMPEQYPYRAVLQKQRNENVHEAMAA